MMRASGWLAEQHAADQRRFLNLLAGSFVAHALFVAVLSFTPTPDAPLLPEVLRVDLVASLPPAGPASRPAPKAAPPAPKPVPKAEPAPPPEPVPKQVVLPKQAPRAIPHKPVPRPVPPPKPIDYEDALSQLRNELGETAPDPVQPEAAPQADASPAATETAEAAAAENAAWLLAMKRHVRSRYITPPEFLNRSLATALEVLLTSGGELVGAPTVVRSSGDPFFDDNAVRAVMMSAPLPAPPRSGTYTFLFTSEER